MKYTKILLIAMLVCPVFMGFSQRVIFHKTEVDKQYEIPKEGANRHKHFWFQVGLFGTDLAFGELDSKQDFSNYYDFSWNYKFRLNRVLSHGFGWGIHRQVYRLSERGLDALSRGDWDKGKLVYWGGNANYFWRINIDPARGNIIGKYVDLVAFGQLNFYQRAQFSTSNLTEKNTGADFAERYAAGVETRLGRESLSLYLRYKLISDSKATEAYGQLDLAKWSIGLYLSFGG